MLEQNQLAMCPKPFCRREFLAASLVASLGAPALAAAKRAPRILLRSSWQTVNIGDIAHTPGVLALLERHLPTAEVTLWPSDVGHGVQEMLQRRFPALRFARDTCTSPTSKGSLKASSRSRRNSGNSSR